MCIVRRQPVVGVKRPCPHSLGDLPTYCTYLPAAASGAAKNLPTYRKVRLLLIDLRPAAEIICNTSARGMRNLQGTVYTVQCL